MNTVDSIVKGLSKIHDKLVAHAAERSAAASAHIAEAAQHTAEAGIHEAEAGRAKQIADNLNKLLGA